MVSPARSRFSTNHTLVALQDVFFSRILASLHDLVLLDFLTLNQYPDQRTTAKAARRNRPHQLGVRRELHISLTDEQVDKLIAAGRALLRKNPELQRFVAGSGGGRTASR